MRLIDVDLYCATICKCNRRECDKAKCPIHNAPTAYDVDKVVEELEKELGKGNIAIDFGEFRLFEIVKQGGVSDDVCEWKYNDTEYYWESSCDHLHIFMSDGPKENEYDFCPYCGKKIKVVE